MATTSSLPELGTGIVVNYADDNHRFTVTEVHPYDVTISRVNRPDIHDSLYLLNGNTLQIMGLPYNEHTVEIVPINENYRKAGEEFIGAGDILAYEQLSSFPFTDGDCVIGFRQVGYSPHLYDPVYLEEI